MEKSGYAYLMPLVTSSIYWVVVTIWSIVLATIVVLYLRNSRSFGTTRLLLIVVGLDTFRNIVENTYFGLFFGGQYGLFPKAIATLLGNPFLLIVPKVFNVAAGCIVLTVLLFRWLPEAVRERNSADLRGEHLKELAATDGMTGLWNRQEFMVLADAEWRRSRRYRRLLSLVMFDIDNFKSINDRYGHAAGDEVIMRIAKVCIAYKRNSDVVGRLGGEEFALLLPETSPSEAEVVAERLRDQISREIISLGAIEINVTISMGISEASQSSSCKELIGQSDLAMYEAKNTGRNRVCYYKINSIESSQEALPSR
jgi:diguanylate cyclase (GGDEF)-like protein